LVVFLREFANGSMVQPPDLSFRGSYALVAVKGEQVAMVTWDVFSVQRGSPNVSGFCYGKSAQVDLGVAPKNRTPPYFI
jgi:hypothetical protein